MITTYPRLRRSARRVIGGLLGLAVALGLSLAAMPQAHAAEPGPWAKLTYVKQKHASERRVIAVTYPTQNDGGDEVQARNYIEIKNGKAKLLKKTKMIDKKSKHGWPKVKMVSSPKKLKCKPGEVSGPTRFKLRFYYQPAPIDEPGLWTEVRVKGKRCGVGITSVRMVI